MLKVIDQLYGEFEIHPILHELMNSQAIQRLKEVHQGGGTFLVNDKWCGTRYEHSVGVMLLIKLLGGSIEEQILGLLHDVSHTAFSHVIDYVIEDESEEFHETIYEEMVLQSDIPQILKNYGYECKEILTMESHRLEAPLPLLCADRIDYTLRDMYNCGYITYQEIQDFLASLRFVDNKIVVESLEMAEWFTNTYYREVIDYFMHPLNVYVNHELASVLKQALEEDVLELDDFKQDDRYVLNKIKESKHRDLIKQLRRLHPNVKLIEDETNYTIKRKLKPRMVDPMILGSNGEVIHLSEVSKAAKGLIEDALKQLEKGVYLRVEY